MKIFKSYGSVTVGSLLILSMFILPAALPQDNKGLDLLYSHEYAKAETALRETLKSNPEDIGARYYLGVALINQRKYAEALKELEMVEKTQKETRSKIPSIYERDLALAQAYVGLDQFGKAWPKLESAGAEQPESSDVYLQRGIYYYKQKNYIAAENNLSKALKLDSPNAYVYYFLGMMYKETESYDKMQGVFEKFLEIAPNAPESAEVRRLIKLLC
jgi:cytochrome c-type biogenesis protein CcmH/NrfG